MDTRIPDLSLWSLPLDPSCRGAEEDHGEIIHVLDLLSFRVQEAVAVGRQLAEHGLDGLQHLAVVHDEPPVLDGQLDDVASERS